jgi:hypothetical protein
LPSHLRLLRLLCPLRLLLRLFLRHHLLHHHLIHCLLALRRLLILLLRFLLLLLLLLLLFLLLPSFLNQITSCDVGSIIFQALLNGECVCDVIAAGKSCQCNSTRLSTYPYADPLLNSPNSGCCG